MSLLTILLWLYLLIFLSLSCSSSVDPQLNGFDQKRVQCDGLPHFTAVPQTPLDMPKCSFTCVAGRHTHCAHTIEACMVRIINAGHGHRPRDDSFQAVTN